MTTRVPLHQLKHLPSHQPVKLYRKNVDGSFNGWKDPGWGREGDAILLPYWEAISSSIDYIEERDCLYGEYTP